MIQTELLLRCKLAKGMGYKKLLQLAEQLPGKVTDLAFEDACHLNLPLEILTAIRRAFSDEFDKTIKRIYQQCLVISFFDDAYPEPLRQIYQPPLLLFAQGDLRLLKRKIVTIVGSRTPTRYSEDVIKEIVPKLVSQNYVIASGMAKGVDSLAHRAALEHSGMTIAVVGHGLNHIYPAQNKLLHHAIVNSGLILSEYLPDTPPRPFRFPERNRILAGLCQSVIVTEAKAKSGSLITVHQALEANRDIYAIPGPINSPLSEGPNRLIAAGAMPIVEFDLNFKNLY
ncbi:MAG: DNA-processing protein DprA [Lactobacillus sp.]|nr:DNA-processing protein DprA [Lactobacillus sp.]